jgi:hypothetical protein
MKVLNVAAQSRLLKARSILRIFEAVTAAPEDLLARLSERGFKLSVHAEKLRVVPASHLTEEDRTAIRHNRDHLLRLIELGSPVRAPLKQKSQTEDHESTSATKDRFEGVNPRVAAEVAAEIRRIEADAYRLGWSRERLWNADFWPHTRTDPRGLASVLSPGDRITEVNEQFILFVRHHHKLRFFRSDS